MSSAALTRGGAVSPQVATKLDLVPQSTVRTRAPKRLVAAAFFCLRAAPQLRWIWRAEFASTVFATYWAPFLLYWWRVIVFGVGDAG